MSQQSNRTIVVVGNRAVGKSAIVHQLAEEKHDFDVYRPTIDDCYNITWKLPGEQRIKLDPSLSINRQWFVNGYKGNLSMVM